MRGAGENVDFFWVEDTTEDSYLCKSPLRAR